MLRFEWNGLRPGDEVLVHDAGRSDLALAPGVVIRIDRHRDVNGVGIRIEAGSGPPTIQWPSLVAVHRDPRDPTEPCWRCTALAPAP